ncbi:MAG TPA: hypothetical protein ENO16_03755 [Chromatiales bacterium]|nr:hypothetical protein [Chromatiales bacterium]
MDSDTMQKLARFKIMARRLGGFNVDIFRMAQETGYAREMLQRAQEVESENLILLAIELYEALGLLDEPKAKAAPREPAPPVEEVGDGGGRYVFGARG